LGKINKIQIKKHHKYQSVKAAITLESDYEKLFVDENVWKVKILIGRDKAKQKVLDVRWFPGYYTVKL
jgi:hypothetical protein